MSNKWDGIVTCSSTGKKFEAVGFGKVGACDHWLHVCSVIYPDPNLGRLPDAQVLRLKPVPSRGEKGYKYWYITECVSKTVDARLDRDKANLHFGNYFDTKEEAQAALDKINSLDD